MQHRSKEGGLCRSNTRSLWTKLILVVEEPWIKIMGLLAGTAWEDLPQELVCSYKTCTRRLAEWTEQGIWQRMHNHPNQYPVIEHSSPHSVVLMLQASQRVSRAVAAAPCQSRKHISPC